MEEQNKINWRALIIILIVLALGLFIVNQFMEYRYNAMLLTSPCVMCQEKNKEVAGCIYSCFHPFQFAIMNVTINLSDVP